MRKTILKIAAEKKYSIQESPVKLTQLKKAEEIWLTNAISGIKWVAQSNQNSPLQNTSHAQICIERVNRV